MRGKSGGFQAVCFLTVTGLLSQLVAFVFRILLSQKIGAEVMGLYQLLMPLFGLLMALCSVGLSSGVSYLSAQFSALGEGYSLWGLRRGALGLFFLVALLPLSGLLLFSDAISVYILGDARTQMGILLLVPCLLLTGIENLQKYYFYGVGFVVPPALTELLEQLLRSMFILALLYRFMPISEEKMLALIVLGMIGCEIFSAITQTALFQHHVSPLRYRGERKSPRELRGRLCAIAVPVGATAVLATLIGAANSILVPRLLCLGGMTLSEAMSSFGVMFGMTLPMLYLPTAFLGALNLVLAPKLSKSLALGQRGEIRRRIKKAVAAANILLIPLLSFMAVFGGEVGAYLYGDARVGEHLPLLSLGVLFSCWQGLLGNCLNGLNLQKDSAKIAIFADGIQLLVTILLVKKLGLLGFVWAFVLSNGIGTYASWRRLSKETGLRLAVFQCFVAPSLAGALGASVTALLYKRFLDLGMALLPCTAYCFAFATLLYMVALQVQGLGIRDFFPKKDLPE